MQTLFSARPFENRVHEHFSAGIRRSAQRIDESAPQAVEPIDPPNIRPRGGLRGLNSVIEYHGVVYAEMVKLIRAGSTRMTAIETTANEAAAERDALRARLGHTENELRNVRGTLDTTFEAQQRDRYATVQDLAAIRGRMRTVEHAAANEATAERDALRARLDHVENEVHGLRSTLEATLEAQQSHRNATVQDLAAIRGKMRAIEHAVATDVSAVRGELSLIGYHMFRHPYIIARTLEAVASGEREVLEVQWTEQQAMLIAGFGRAHRPPVEDAPESVGEQFQRQANYMNGLTDRINGLAESNAILIEGAKHYEDFHNECVTFFENVNASIDRTNDRLTTLENRATNLTDRVQNLEA